VAGCDYGGDRHYPHPSHFASQMRCPSAYSLASPTAQAAYSSWLTRVIDYCQRVDQILSGELFAFANDADHGRQTERQVPAKG